MYLIQCHPPPDTRAWNLTRPTSTCLLMPKMTLLGLNSFSLRSCLLGNRFSCWFACAHRRKPIEQCRKIKTMKEAQYRVLWLCWCLMFPGKPLLSISQSSSCTQNTACSSAISKQFCSREIMEKIAEWKSAVRKICSWKEQLAFLWYHVLSSQAIPLSISSSAPTMRHILSLFVSLFLPSQIGFLCVALRNLFCKPVWLWNQWFACICFPNTGIKGMCHHAQFGARSWGLIKWVFLNFSGSWKIQ